MLSRRRSPSGRLPWAAWSRARRLALDRDDWRCKCGSPADLEVHQVRPVAEGGEPFALANLATLCRECHLSAHLDPERRAWRRLLAGDG